ncbi:MAG TPA: DHA2 family efflux MFS transporter permease subunit [Acidimicrobiales bacterium]|nr:DHA2 family efflux MFS transporter permease subunit [Acidimicrobiales bacterium]
MRSTSWTARRSLWAFVITSVASFMAALDNLVVTTALPSIRDHLHAGLGGLEWTVNAFTLTFAVLLLTGASLGDRYGRRRLFAGGLVVFTLGSALAALAPGVGWLIAARALQGVGGAVVMPLSLTILSASVPPERRNLAFGAWGAVTGLAVAVGPVVGGAIVSTFSWQWIFWLNVPIGLVLLPLALTRLEESRGPSRRLDLPGLALASAGLLGVVLAMVRSTSLGWSDAEVWGGLVTGLVLLGAFVAWEARAAEPMLPLRLFRSRSFSAGNAASLLMSFGMFGSIFLLAQFLQLVQHESPLSAGVHTLPWTAMPILVAPLGGLLTERIGGRAVLTTGLVLQSLGLLVIGLVLTPTVAYAALVPAFVVGGTGMALFFAPMASTVLSAVSREEEGIASGTNNSLRELGGVLGIAVLASVFSARGGYGSGAAFVAGTVPAVIVGAGVVLAGAAAAFLLPGRRPAPVAGTVETGDPGLLVEVA